MKNFLLIILVLVCVSLAAFLPGFAWGHFAARRSVATDQKIVELVSTTSKVEHYRSFTFACDGQEYFYETPVGMSSRRNSLPQVHFFDNYDQALNYLLFGNGILVSNAAMMGRGVLELPKKGKVGLAFGAAAVAGYGFTKGYQVGFNRSLDCAAVQSKLTAGLWKNVAAKLEQRNHDNFVLKMVRAEHIRVIPGDYKRKVALGDHAWSPSPGLLCDYSSLLPIPRGTTAYAKLTSAHGTFETRNQYLASDFGLTHRGSFHFELENIPSGDYKVSIFLNQHEVANETLHIGEQESTSPSCLTLTCLYLASLQPAQKISDWTPARRDPLSGVEGEVSCLAKLPPSSDVSVCLPTSTLSLLGVRPPASVYASSRYHQVPPIDAEPPLQIH